MGKPLFQAMSWVAGLGALLGGLAACSDGSFGGQNLALRSSGRGPAAAGTPGPLTFQNNPNQPTLKALAPVEVAGMNLALGCPEVLDDEFPGDNRGTLGCYLMNRKDNSYVKGGYAVTSVAVSDGAGTKLTSSHKVTPLGDGRQRVDVTVLVTEVERLSTIRIASLAQNSALDVQAFDIDDPPMRRKILHDIYKGDYFDIAYDDRMCADSGTTVRHVTRKPGERIGEARCDADSMIVFYSEDYRKGSATSIRDVPPSIACCKLRYPKILWKADHSGPNEPAPASSNGPYDFDGETCPSDSVATGVRYDFQPETTAQAAGNQANVGGIVGGILQGALGAGSTQTANPKWAKTLLCTKTDGRLGMIDELGIPIIVPSRFNGAGLSALLQLVATINLPILNQGSASSFGEMRAILDGFSERTVLGCPMTKSMMGWQPLNPLIRQTLGAQFSNIAGNSKDRIFPGDMDPLLPKCRERMRAIGQNFEYTQFE